MTALVLKHSHNRDILFLDDYNDCNHSTKSSHSGIGIYSHGRWNNHLPCKSEDNIFTHSPYGITDSDCAVNCDKLSRELSRTGKEYEKNRRGSQLTVIVDHRTQREDHPIAWSPFVNTMGSDSSLQSLKSRRYNYYNEDLSKQDERRPKHGAMYNDDDFYSEINLQNDHYESENAYEEINHFRKAPPEITPVSGILTQEQLQCVIRPTACRPAMIHQDAFSSFSSRYNHPAACPQLPPPRILVQDTSATVTVACDEGYSSQDGIHCHSANSNTSLKSSGSSSASSSNHNSQPFLQLHNCLGPSWCASDLGEQGVVKKERGVIAEVEPLRPSVGAMDSTTLILQLREKDVEIEQLRETMARNELAMLRVFAERRQGLENELRETRARGEHRMRATLQKAFNAEQVLLMKLRSSPREVQALRLENERLQSEKVRNYEETRIREKNCIEVESCEQDRKSSLDRLRMKVETLRVEKLRAEQRCLLGQREISNLRKVLEEDKWERCRLRGEIAKLEDELKILRDSQAADRETAKNFEIGFPMPSEHTTGLFVCNNCQLSRTEKGVDQQKFPEKSYAKMYTELEELKEAFACQKDQWLIEKAKVIFYQKVLQMNCERLSERNKQLETEIRRLILEVEI